MKLDLRLARPAVLATLALTACKGGSTAASLPTEGEDCAAIQERLGTALDAAVTARGVTGAAAAVDVDGCSFRLASGAANPNTAEPLRAQGLFRIGSITKTFTATLVLMLRAEGRLSLDDLVSDHVAGVPGGAEITVRRLLDHTSGLYNYTDSKAFWEASQKKQSFTPEELIAFAADHTPYFSPGKGFHYSNTNYIVAGLIAEKVGGAPLEKQLRERILGPAGLAHTYFDGKEAPLPGLVSGYVRSEQTYDDVTHADSPSGAWAAGALVSSTDDVNRFIEALLRGDVLAPDELREMTTWTKTNLHQAPGYGLGLSEHETPLGVAYGHIGSYVGYDAWSMGLPERGTTITVLSNLYEAGTMEIADSLAGALR